MIIPYVHKDEIYDTIKIAHINCLHGGIKKTFKACKSLAANIKLSHVKAYISLCSQCNYLKIKPPRKSIKSIVSNHFGERGQVDLIDIQKIINEYKIKDTSYKYILNYQDNMTKFCLLRGLKNKKAKSIIGTLEGIFAIFGAPKILQTDNGGEFVNKEIDLYFEQIWPDMKHIKSRPYHPQSQGSVERANGDVKRMLKKYLLSSSSSSSNNNNDNNPPPPHLLVILDRVQFHKNTSFNRTLGKSPYEVIFGQSTPINPNFFFGL